MRRKKTDSLSPYKIIILDDEIGIIEAISFVFRRNGYDVIGVTSPTDAIVMVHNGKFDLLILDYLMSPINGDVVVAQIREFNSELYILMLTGHKDMAPPLETLHALEIQGYCEKGDKFEQLLLMVESAIKCIVQMRAIKRFQNGLNRILEAVPKIYQLQPIGSILEGILTDVMCFVNSENAFILVDSTEDMNSKHNSIFRGIGQYNRNIEDFMAMLDPELMERIRYARTNNKIDKMDTGVIIPLINEYKEIFGIIYVESCNYESEIKLIEIYANQAGFALNNAFLHSLVNIKNEELIRTYLELRKTYIDTIEALRLTVDARDEYTCGHSDRVAFYSHKVGQGFGLSLDELELLSAASVFHDIGKIGISDAILKKPEKLTQEEYANIKQHPLKGAHILSALSMFKDVVPLVKYHHEWVNGTGYPEGLKGDEIPLLSRILSVSDAFDAMISNRRYRTKLDITHAKEQLLQGAGIQFDAEVVGVFIKEIIDNIDELMVEIKRKYNVTQ